MDKPVPIISHHSVGIPNPEWRWNFLTCPYNVFENRLKWLKKCGYKTITLNDLYSYVIENKRISKSCVITLDDGYVDNWVFAYPFLKKYGMKATIFVSPEFIDVRNIKRKRLDEIQSEDEINKLETIGFLSWDEMFEMEESGVVDFQSHALTHTWNPASEKIIDFRHPGDPYIWMTWNQNKKKKPFLQTDNADLIMYGEPVYENERSLSGRKYYPDQSLAKYLIDYVKNSDKEKFFSNKDWRQILWEEYDLYRKNHKIKDAYETEENYHNRIYQELIESKRILEEKLHKKIGYLCWPNGSATTAGLKISEAIGYKMSTVTPDIFNLIKKVKNSPKVKVNRFVRLNPILYNNRKTYLNSEIVYADGFSFMLHIYNFRSNMLFSFIAKILIKIVKVKTSLNSRNLILQRGRK